MSEESTPVGAEVEARFRALANAVSDEDWNKLIGAVSDRLLKRLALIGLVAEPDADKLQQARQMIGELLVEYTNVALTCVAQGQGGEK
jgi:hypothetical protein